MKSLVLRRTSRKELGISSVQPVSFVLIYLCNYLWLKNVKNVAELNMSLKTYIRMGCGGQEEKGRHK